jgi:hypothetical protein
MKRLNKSIKFYRIISISVGILSFGWYGKLKITEEISSIDSFMIVMFLVILMFNLIILDLILIYIEIKLKENENE